MDLKYTDLTENGKLAEWYIKYNIIDWKEWLLQV